MELPLTKLTGLLLRCQLHRTQYANTVKIGMVTNGALLFFALSFFVSCMYTWGIYIADIYDMKLKGAISHAIFQKSLRVQTVSQKLVETEEEMKKREKSIQKGKNDMASATSTGKIINLMTNDTNNVSMLPMSVTNILIVPVQVGVLLYLIHDTIGDAIFVGLSVIVAMIPITGLLLVFLIKYTTRLNKVMDNRVKISNETLQGIRVVKFYGWEKSLRKKIFQIRDEELGWLFKQVFVSTGWGMLFTIFPVALMIIVFSYYVNVEGMFHLPNYPGRLNRLLC